MRKSGWRAGLYDTMKKILLSRNILSGITAIVFFVMYVISQTFLKEMYLFYWTSDHYYLYIFIIALILIFLRKNILSFSLTFGSIIGIFLGQFGGDFIRNQNKLKITPDMTPELIYQLNHHPGVEIWLLTTLIFVIAGVVVSGIWRR